MRKKSACVLEFILASSNLHKAQEFEELFQGQIQVKPAPKKLEPEESGESFTENALIKAKAYYEQFGVPTLADDSGLVVEALPELLGVQSARFCSDKPDYKDKCLQLIQLLSEQINRRAHFVCVLCFYLSPSEVYFFEGQLKGEIAHAPKGEHGFGYDPVFIPSQEGGEELKSLAELPEWKNEHSHRARAVQAAFKFFKNQKR
jgi:XTP/dITP diphosphohydrolase